MNNKSHEQIEIEVHLSNAIKLLKKSREIQISASDLESLDYYIAKMKQAVEFQIFSANEIQKATNLQNLLLCRQPESIRQKRTQFGLN